MLCPNQNGFLQEGSTTSHILTLQRIVNKLENHNREAIITFIDLRKAIDSLDHLKSFQILGAYGIPLDIVKVIQITYENTSEFDLQP